MSKKKLIPKHQNAWQPLIRQQSVNPEVVQKNQERLQQLSQHSDEQKQKKESEEKAKQNKTRNSLNKIDNFVNSAEKALGVTGLGLMGATTAAPNPYTLGAAYVNSLASGAIDVYQIARALYNQDYQNVTKNSMDLLLSLVGAKLFKNAKNFKQADEILSQSGAPRKLVTRTIGRGRGRHKVTWPYEKARYNETIGPAYVIDAFGNAMNLMDVKTEDETE